MVFANKESSRILNVALFLLFLFSGFCSLLYQVVWMRIAYAAFGVITPVLSVVISVFMLGLALGSFIGGKWIFSLVRRYKLSPIIFYALTEFLIGLGAFAVPKLFSLGGSFLLSAGQMNSFNYLFLSGIVMTVSILPWCVLMGFTYPFMMSFLKGYCREETNSFSYLYLANVAGAICGTLVTALVLIERVGLHSTLLIAASLNFLIAIMSVVIGVRYPCKIKAAENIEKSDNKIIGGDDVSGEKPAFIYLLLLITGFTSMAMEVVWVRAFTIILLTTTYSFATLLAAYLFATWIGSLFYRDHLKKNSVLATGDILAYLSVFSFLPIVMNDPRMGGGIPMVVASILPFCAALGYLTPKLIDEYSSGRPSKAGMAYAVNIAGCVAGPLLAGYVLLPALGVLWSLVILALPFLAFLMFYYRDIVSKSRWHKTMAVLAVVLLVSSVFINASYEELYARFRGSVVRRDHTATVISIGEGMNKMLLVNGIGITRLTVITKMMAHLPLAFCQNKPESALVICLGMGTSYRSALSWGIKTTVVELVPSVKDALGYYFEDAAVMLANPNGEIVIDDGRRFLNRTDKRFDVITIDPPPPVEAAGSSLLYSEEFYRLIKKRLKEKGILQQWFPGGELKILQAVARALSNSFPYVRVYKSVEGWGFHFIASMSPLESFSVQKIISRMPASAKVDMMEWNKTRDPEDIVHFVLKSEVPLSSILNSDKRITITDDKPYNEYYFLRRGSIQ